MKIKRKRRLENPQVYTALVQPHRHAKKQLLYHIQRYSICGRSHSLECITTKGKHRRQRGVTRVSNARDRTTSVETQCIIKPTIATTEYAQRGDKGRTVTTPNTVIINTGRPIVLQGLLVVPQHIYSGQR